MAQQKRTTQEQADEKEIPLVGLNNVGGASCYLNTALQQLFSVKPLIKDIVTEHIGSNGTIKELKKVLEEMMHKQCILTKDRLKALYKDYKVKKTGDAEEALQFILQSCMETLKINEIFGKNDEISGTPVMFVGDQDQLQQRLAVHTADYAIVYMPGGNGGYDGADMEGFEMISAGIHTGAHWYSLKKVNGEWYEVNDKKVTKIVPKNVQSSVKKQGRLFVFKRK